MSVATFTKDPDAILDYVLDWADWLNGATISTSAWTVPAGITSVTTSNTTSTTTIRLSGGTAGSNYEITNRVTTNGGQVDERSIVIQVRQSTVGWSYDPQCSTSKDKVRFLIQDTDTNDQLITDAEISFLLTAYPSIYRAAAGACRSIALQLGRELSLSAPAMAWSADEQYQHYMDLAKTLESSAAQAGGLTIFAGGISIADRDTREQDTDRMVPSFTTSTLQDSALVNELTDRSS